MIHGSVLDKRHKETSPPLSRGRPTALAPDVQAPIQTFRYTEAAMSFDFRNLKNLQHGTLIRVPTDEDGLVGRECPAPDCVRYFKVKFGTGLKGPNLPCHCPYCGHKGPQNEFRTPDQIAYVRSYAKLLISDAIHQDLKQLEFRSRYISLKVTRGSRPIVRHYAEKDLETHVTCSACTLEYAIYGVFAFCPDCRSHNSEQILEKNLGLISRQVDLAARLEDADLRRHLIEDALENCVSSLDGFGREACRVRADKSGDPAKCLTVSFQNLEKADKRLKDLFGIDLRSAVQPPKWETAHRGFMKRHVVAHRAGVVDQQYIDETGDRGAILGRLVPLDAKDVADVAEATSHIGRTLLALLPEPTRKA